MPICLQFACFGRFKELGNINGEKQGIGLQILMLTHIKYVWKAKHGETILILLDVRVWRSRDELKDSGRVSETSNELTLDVNESFPIRSLPKSCAGHASFVISFETELDEELVPFYASNRVGC